MTKKKWDRGQRRYSVLLLHNFKEEKNTITQEDQEEKMAKEGNIYCVYTMCLFLPDNVLEFQNMPHKNITV